MKALTLTFTVDKETKNTVRYEEVVKGDAEPQVGIVYVPKSTLGDYRGDLTVAVKPKR